MGLFSAIGKIGGGIAHAVGNVARGSAAVATLGGTEALRNKVANANAARQQSKDAASQSVAQQLAEQQRQFNLMRSDANKQATNYEAQGKQIANTTFANGALGRYDPNQAMALRSTDMQDIINRRRSGLEGLNSAEGQALQEKALGGIQEQQATNLRALRSAQGGTVSPARAAAQQAQLLKSSDSARGNLQRDLLLENYNTKQKALEDFQNAVGGAENTEQERLGFNVGQQNKEAYGQLASKLGFGQLASGARSGATQTQIAQDQNNALQSMIANQGGK